MKKSTVLILLMLIMLNCVGCTDKSDDISFRQAATHSEQKINQKRTTDKIVYTTRGSKEYHRSSCKHKLHTLAIKTSDAKKSGLAPCAVCRP